MSLSIILGIPLTFYIGPTEWIKLKPEVCWVSSEKITINITPLRLVI